MDHMGRIELLFEVDVVVDYVFLDDPASLIDAKLVRLSLGSMKFVHCVVFAHQNRLHLHGINILR